MHSSVATEYREGRKWRREGYKIAKLKLSTYQLSEKLGKYCIRQARMQGVLGQGVICLD